MLRQGERCGHAGAVIVSARRAEDRIVMRADQKNFATHSGNLSLDIAAGLAAQVEPVARALGADSRMRTRRLCQHSKRFAPRRKIARMSAMKYVVGKSAPSA